MPKVKSQENVSTDTRKHVAVPVGSLYVVGMPIGNHEDITLRALNVLKHVSLVAAEDTLATRTLLDRYGIQATLTTYHRGNSEDKIPVLIEQLCKGHNIALVADAGTPVIFDPGCLLVARAVEAGIRVVPIPGPSAVTVALSVSGFSGDSFSFYGQVPKKNFLRRRFFEARRSDDRTLVLYAPARSLRTILKTIRSVLGERRIVVALDMTKPSERFLRGRISDLLRRTDWEFLQGEATVVVEGNKPRR